MYVVVDGERALNEEHFTIVFVSTSTVPARDK